MKDKKVSNISLKSITIFDKGNKHIFCLIKKIIKNNRKSYMIYLSIYPICLISTFGISEITFMVKLFKNHLFSIGYNHDSK